jgi:hypothetical protein
VRCVCVARAEATVPLDGVVCLYLFSRPFLGRCFHESSHRKLLEFRWNDESGELVDSIVMNGPADTSFSYSMENLHAGKSPFLYIPSCPQQVFDTRTRVFYELPEFRVALVRGGSYK